MTYKAIVDNINREEWEGYAANFTDYSIYQTWPYQQVRAEVDGQTLSRFVIKDENGHVSTMGHVRIKIIKPLGLKIGYVQWGPLLWDKNRKLSCTTAALRQLCQAYLGNRVNVLRIVPNVWKDEIGIRVTKMLESSGFKCVPNVPTYHTMVVSLYESEEDIRKRLHRGWRRNLEKAEKAGVKIKQGRNNEYFDILEKLYSNALNRKKFKGLDPQEFTRPQHMLSAQEKMSITVGYYDDEPVTALATSNLGDTAVDILAANSEKALQCGSSFLVYWRALTSAKSAEMKRYDLGGINPENNPTVYEFKRRIGGEERFHIGAFEICSNSVVKRIWRTGEWAYRFVKR